MEAIEALWLGILQGLTEFLPVSSSGHLVLAEAWLGLRNPGIVFEVALHAGTLGAVVLFYRRRIGELARGAAARDPAALAYLGKLALATTPAVLATLAARSFLEAQFEDARVAAAGLWVTGLLLWTTRRTLPLAHAPAPGWAAAWWIGCAQALAILPGISRSGATVSVALALGVAPLAAAEFSFLMSVIAVAGAVVLTVPEATAADATAQAHLLLGGAAALVSGVVALALFVRVLRTRHFYRFAWYVWALGAAAMLWMWRAG